ncbi:MAG: hypothetical protein KDC98_05070 [Planctomycetes bacterium]|nr:hypothetical protein [Planctomycetota bacterium]
MVIPPSRVIVLLSTLFGSLGDCACLAQTPVFPSSVRRFPTSSLDTESRNGPALKVVAHADSSAVLRFDGRIFVQGITRGTHTPPELPVGVVYTDLDFGVTWGTVVRSDGIAEIWGSSSIMPTVPALPTGLRYQRVVQGNAHLLLWRSDGAWIASGSNTHGQCNVPNLPIGVSFIDVQAKFNDSMALLSDGSLIHWGWNLTGVGNVPPLPTGVTYTSFRLGVRHVLARRSDGTLVGWGDNFYQSCNVPPPPPGTQYVTYGAGSIFSIAWRSDGVFTVWGNNNSLAFIRPPSVPAGLTCLEIACGGAHVIARMSDGSVLAWGANTFMQAFIPRLPSGTASQPMRYLDAAIGETYTAVLYSDGTVDVWGKAALVTSVTPPPAPTGMHYERIEAGDHHMACLRSDGMVIASGDNSVGQCNVPPLPTGMRYTDFDVSGGNTVLIRSDGAALAIGDNTNGQLNIPPLPPGIRYVEGNSFWYRICLLRSDGVVTYAGTPYAHPVPSLPSGLSYVQMAPSASLALLLRSDGTVVTWGWNSYPSYTAAPPTLPFGTYFVEVTSGASADVCAVRSSDGRVYLVGSVYLGHWQTPPLEAGTSYVDIAGGGDFDIVTRVGPTSTYVGFAAGCSGSLPAARLVPRDTPHIDSIHEVTVFELPQNMAIMVFGWTAMSTPVSLGQYGMPGCTAHVPADAAYLISGQDNQARSRLTIPNLPGLVGLHFYNQAFVLDSNAGNPLGAVVSDAAEGVIGHW